MMMVMKLFCIVPLLRKISVGESPGLDLTIPLPIDADLLSWKVNAFGWRDLYLYSQSSKYFLKNHSRGSSCHASKVFSTSQVKVTWDMPVRSRDILVSSRTPLVSMSRFPPYLQTFYEVLPFHQKCILGLILFNLLWSTSHSILVKDYLMTWSQTMLSMPWKMLRRNRWSITINILVDL